MLNTIVPCATPANYLVGLAVKAGTGHRGTYGYTPEGEGAARAAHSFWLEATGQRRLEIASV